MKEMQMQIVGAPYATLAGEMAAQILYIDPHRVPCTLYEAPASVTSADLQPLRRLDPTDAGIQNVRSC